MSCKHHAPAGNRTRGPTMATLDFATKPLVLMSTYDNMYHYKPVQTYPQTTTNKMTNIDYLLSHILFILNQPPFIVDNYTSSTNKGMFPFICNYIQKLDIQLNMILCWTHIDLKVTFSLSDQFFRNMYLWTNKVSGLKFIAFSKWST